MTCESKGIGDILSTAAGSAARYNEGKPAVELIPLLVIYEALGESTRTLPLYHLGRFQLRLGSDQENIGNTIRSVGADWENCARVFDYGRRKYAEWNWLKGMPWSAALGSASRHMLARIGGEVVDPESGLTHKGHIMCNLVILSTYVSRYPAGDDRPHLPEKT